MTPEPLAATAADVLDVTTLNRAVAGLLGRGFPLVRVRGEIGNLTRAASGHWYFTLKDDAAQVRCVMFRGRNALVGFAPREGDEVEVRAQVGLYEARGEFQLTVEALQRAGQGRLFEEFLRLKARLAAEGLFDIALKRPLPALPRSVGIVTSLQAAALRDVVTTLQRRAPYARLIVYPVPVQGAGAGARIAAMLAAAAARSEAEVLLLVRGGGSLEDLWAFNDEAVARAITPKTRMIFLTNPNNPTGRLIAEDELRRLAALADRHGIWLVVDEVYAGLEWVGPRPPSVSGLTPFGITTGSVSKALGLQGLRTGWLICQNAGVIRDAMILRENASEIMNTLGEHIAEVALRPDRLANALGLARAEGRATLDRLDRHVAEEPRLSWHRPEAGLIGLARVQGISGEALARALLEPPWRTFLLPGSAYGQPEHVRLGVGGGPEARMEEGLRRLRHLLAGYDSATL